MPGCRSLPTNTTALPTLALTPSSRASKPQTPKLSSPSRQAAPSRPCCAACRTSGWTSRWSRRRAICRTRRWNRTRRTCRKSCSLRARRARAAAAYDPECALPSHASRQRSKLRRRAARFAGGSCLDPIGLLAEVLEKRGLAATPEQLRAMLPARKIGRGARRYNFIATPQRGVSENWVIMERWDPDKDAWFAISKPGGTIGNSPGRKPIARNVTLRRNTLPR